MSALLNGAASVSLLLALVVQFGCSSAVAPTPQSPGPGAPSGSAVAPRNSASESLEALAAHLVQAAGAHDFQSASRDFGSVMKDALPVPRLAAVWGTLEEKLGPFKAIEKVEVRPEHGLHSAFAVSRFEIDRVTIKVVFDDTKHVVGLFFVPVTSAWQAPPYVDPHAFSERDVVVGLAPELPGTLSLPKTDQLVPGVVLVHGSGPSDRDESVGAVKMFKDLALGLATRKIAVLRYVKRSRLAPLGIITQKEEVLDGAHAAIALLRATPGVDPRKVFVLGHSQGGALAPRIAHDDPLLAGIIVLAGPTRPIQDALLAQLEYLDSVNDGASDFAPLIEAARRFKTVADDPKLAPDQVVALPTGGQIEGAYLLDARGYDPARDARSLACAMFVLQGERDYQVSMSEYQHWVTLLADHDLVVLKSYPALNHLFVSGTGRSTPAEYAQPGHVDPTVIDDIAHWIASR